MVRSNEKHCVCNVFATPHSKNPVKSSVPSSASVNLLYYSERDLFTPQNEIVLRSFYIRGQRIRVCAGTSRWKAAGKILARLWKDHGGLSR